MAVHVYWDNSNIWIGLQKYCLMNEKVPPSALRVYLRNLDDYVIRGRVTGEKMIAGSYPPECDELLDIARSVGYDTRFFYRIDDGTKIREQAVDGNLQLHMSLCLLKGKPREVLCILTGDSNIDPDSGTSFIEIVELALKRQWSVEVYAIKDTISVRKYQQLKDRFGEDLQIEYLDNIYNSITYLVEGDYYYKSDPGNLIHVPQRIVLPKTW